MLVPAKEARTFVSSFIEQHPIRATPLAALGVLRTVGLDRVSEDEDLSGGVQRHFRN